MIEVTCKHCGSTNVVKAGKIKLKSGDKTRYYCKDCKKYFTVMDRKIKDKILNLLDEEKTINDLKDEVKAHHMTIRACLKELINEGNVKVYEKDGKKFYVKNEYKSKNEVKNEVKKTNNVQLQLSKIVTFVKSKGYATLDEIKELLNIENVALVKRMILLLVDEGLLSIKVSGLIFRKEYIVWKGENGEVVYSS